jgi:chromosome segregation ATPase
MSSESAQSTIERKNELMSDITKLRAQVENGLAMGDSMFGQFAHVDVTNEVNQRLSELKTKKETLENQLREKEALVQRSNRDFSDVKDALPETQEHTRIQFVEDYTMMFLLLSYVFMVVSAIIFYVTLSEQKMKAFFYSLLLSVFLTVLCGLLLYFVA